MKTRRGKSVSWNPESDLTAVNLASGGKCECAQLVIVAAHSTHEPIVPYIHDGLV